VPDPNRRLVGSDFCFGRWQIRGGRVIGVTSTKQKAEFVEEAGADEVIISKHSDIAKEARRITEGRGLMSCTTA
jgi:D-arabinose 1-dehydrogenase-like Zn-dependent alcohol dehydrogenase